MEAQLSDLPETNCCESARDRHVMVTTVYISFLVRLWREPRPQPPDQATAWQGEVEHIQSGRRSTFDSLDDLLGFLRRQAENQDVVDRRAGQ
jgi:hypothetical protein